MMIVRNVLNLWLLTCAVGSAAFTSSFRDASFIRSRCNPQNGINRASFPRDRMATAESDSSDPNIQEAEIESTEPTIEVVEPEAGEAFFAMEVAEVETEAAEPEAETLVVEAIEPELEEPVEELAQLEFDDTPALEPAADDDDDDDSKMDRITKLWWQGTRYKKSDALALPPVVTNFAPGVPSSRTVYMQPDPTEPFEWRWVQEQNRFLDRQSKKK